MTAGEVPPLGWLYLYLTRACNLRCVHCWLSAGPAGRPEPGPPLDLLLRLARQALPLGLHEVRLTGGEPLLIPYFETLVRRLGGHGVNVHVETNAMAVTPSVAQALASVGATAAVSLDGEEAYHDEVRGLKGAYARTMGGLARLRDRGVRLSLVMALRRGNMDQIPHVAGVARRFGISSVKVNPVIAMGRAVGLEDLLPATDLLRLVRIYSRRGNDPSSPLVNLDLPPVYWPLAEMHRVPICHYQNTLSVLADGTLALCGLGFEREESRLGPPGPELAATWHQHPLLARLRADLPERLEGICARCLFKRSCRGGCRALSLVAHGSWTAPNPQCVSLWEEGQFPARRLR